MKLYHYSRKDNLAVADPSHHGSGIAGAERRRAQHSHYIKRSYFYAQGDIKEPGLGDECYVAFIPGAYLYDAVKDPDGFRDTARSLAQDGTVCCEACGWEQLIRAAGFAGYRARYGQLDPVALFYAIPVAHRSVVDYHEAAAKTLHTEARA